MRALIATAMAAAVLIGGAGSTVAQPQPDGAGVNARTAPGTRFRDCADCPEMIVVPTGNFLMGTPASEQERFPEEGPQHAVTIPAFALGVAPVTFAEWDACVAAGGCGLRM